MSEDAQIQPSPCSAPAQPRVKLSKSAARPYSRYAGRDYARSKQAHQPLLQFPRFGARSPLRRCVSASLAAGYLGAMAIVGVVAHSSQGMPSGDEFYTPNRPVSVQIVDRYGRDLVVRGAAEMKRAKLDALPEHVVQAIIATEDRRFYDHTGVDPIGLLRAAQRNFEAGYVVQGGSTLSQQLIKNVFLTPEQTYRRKLQEMMLAIWLEYQFTKTEVLETYLSRVYFGGGAWGIEAASQTYFGKEGKDLTPPEGALLAGVLKAPSRYNPAVHPKRAGQRTAIVLAAMEQAGYMSPQARREALLAPVAIERPATDNSANYFADWIWAEMEEIIGTPSQDIVIQTTLDREAQIAASEAVLRHLDPDKNANEAAVVSIDGTGGVQVMVGGRSYSDSQFNRAVQAERQPGSAYKTFVYLAAFKAGLTPWTEFEDAPIKLEDWEPQNFKEDFKGYMSLRKAFMTSVNTVAVQLGETIGRANVIKTAQALGMGQQQPLRSLALGAQVTNPLTLTHAYQPFSNFGDSAPLHGILSISTAEGTPLYDRAPTQAVKTIDGLALGHINRVLVDTVTSGTGQAAQLRGRDVGGKTGTTNDFRDAWFVGFIPDRVTGVWVGSDDYTPMKKVTGATLPARIWRDTMTVMSADMPLRYIPVSKAPPSSAAVLRYPNPIALEPDVPVLTIEPGVAIEGQTEASSAKETEVAAIEVLENPKAPDNVQAVQTVQTPEPAKTSEPLQASDPVQLSKQTPKEFPPYKPEETELEAFLKNIEGALD